MQIPRPNDVLYNTLRGTYVRVIRVRQEDLTWVDFAYAAEHPETGALEVYFNSDVFPDCFDPETITDSFR